jgi:hypothetical protein
MGILKDLIYTIGFMNSQRHQLQVFSKERSEEEKYWRVLWRFFIFVGKEINLSLRDSQ